MRIQYIVGENKEKVGEVMISIIQKPSGFKIRRKGDVETFKNVCLCNGSKYIIKIKFPSLTGIIRFLMTVSNCT